MHAGLSVPQPSLQPGCNILILYRYCTSANSHRKRQIGTNKKPGISPNSALNDRNHWISNGPLKNVRSSSGCWLKAIPPFWDSTWHFICEKTNNQENIAIRVTNLSAFRSRVNHSQFTNRSTANRSTHLTPVHQQLLQLQTHQRHQISHCLSLNSSKGHHTLAHQYVNPTLHLTIITDINVSLRDTSTATYDARSTTH